MRKLFGYLVVLMFIVSPTLSLAQDAPEHFLNSPENINSNPDYTPGDYPLPDINDAKTFYQSQKDELLSAADPTAGNTAFTLGAGELSFTSIKNETAKVLGYFRNYLGSIKTANNGWESIKLVVDINSLDTAVPGRNNRILDLFFQSMTPELGTAVVTFGSFDVAEGVDISDGEEHDVVASGSISLNTISRNIQAKLSVQKSDQTWVVETAEPIEVMLSDFDYSDNAYTLMKECNHQWSQNINSLRNRILGRTGSNMS